MNMLNLHDLVEEVVVVVGMVVVGMVAVDETMVEVVVGGLHFVRS